MKKGFTVKEASKILGVTERTIWNYLKRGYLLKKVRVPGKRERRNPGRKKTYIDKMSLLKYKMRISGIYGMRDIIINHVYQYEKNRFLIKGACKQMKLNGLLLPLEEPDFSKWDNAEEDLEGMEENLDSLLSYEETAAYLEVSLSAVYKYVQRGALKVKKRDDKTGKCFFSFLEVSELYRKKNGLTVPCNDEEKNASLNELISFLEEHPRALEALRELSDFE